MTKEQAISFVETLLGQKCSDIEIIIFAGSWEKKSYHQIALETGYQYEYVKQAGSRLWRSLSKITGEIIRKDNLHRMIRNLQKKNSSKIVSFPSAPKNKTVKEKINPFLETYRIRVS